jgi:outer membrane lipoprotein-sorting protein
MKKYSIRLIFLSLFAVTVANAITADEIVAGYIENTGGQEAWNKVKAVKMIGEMNQGGMKFPFEIVNLNGGRQYVKFSFQGKEMKQGVFDGDTLWSTNFMTMKPEKADAESTANQKLEANDFPFPLFNYKKNGYQLELLGKEENEGAETYKLKLTREPKTVDGKKVDDVSYYYFEVDSLVPLVLESEVKEGPMKGKISESKLGDYQEVDGLYFPFSLTQGIKDGPSVTMVISKVELNPTVDESEFVMPEVKEEAKVDKTESKSK